MRKRKKKKTKQPELHTGSAASEEEARFGDPYRLYLDTSSTTYDGGRSSLRSLRLEGRRLSVARSTAATVPPSPLSRVGEILSRGSFSALVIYLPSSDQEMSADSERIYARAPARAERTTA